MPISPLQSLLMILVVAGVTFFTRAFPFIVFAKTNKGKDQIEYFGKVLPPAIIGMLIIFCLKDVHLFKFPFGLPELISISAVVLLHVWKRNNLLSIMGGTGLYMILIQFVFL